LFKIKGIKREDKYKLLEKVVGDKKDDESVGLRIYCKAALPDPKEKEEAWKELMNIKSKLTADEKKEIIMAFVVRG
jgi:hypothetical protein